jgi:hypothetical protein
VATGAVGDAALVDPSEALARALASETAGPAAAEHPDSTASTPKSSAIIVDFVIMSALGGAQSDWSTNAHDFGRSSSIFSLTEPDPPVGDGQ